MHGGKPTFYDVFMERGISRRDFLGFCATTAVYMGLGPDGPGIIANAMQTKPRIPVFWLHGLECTCCSESFLRSGHPLASDIVMTMISLDYDDTIMAAAGDQAEEILHDIVRDYRGAYILAVEGNVPLANDGMAFIVGGKVMPDQHEHYRWMVEELRVSLFAQELKTLAPVSAQRLEKMWQEIKSL